MFEPFTAEQSAASLQQIQAQLKQALPLLADLDRVQVGTTPKDLVYQEDRIKLYRYRASSEQINPVPVLIVYALVNRPYMADLQPDRSLVKGLLAMGQDVYLLDWGYPQAADRWLTLSDHITGYLRHCVQYLCQQHQQPAINLLGICQGGTFSLCYSTLYPDSVRNLVLMVTPVDFHTPDNRLSYLCKHLDIDLLVDTYGNVPGSLLNQLFISLKPFRLSSQKYVQFLDKLDDQQAVDNFLRMEKWIFDSPDQPGETLRQFAKEFFQQNRLIAGSIELDGQAVRLSRLHMPILNLYALQDHIVPPAASLALSDYISSDDYKEVAFPGGHIGIYVSQRAQHEVPPTIGDWLNKR